MREVLPPILNWLVVSTPPKNIRQLGLLVPIYGKKSKPPNKKCSKPPTSKLLLYIYNPLITIKHGIFPHKTKIYELLIGAFYVGNGWVAGGCWDDDITSDEMDHSRKFPAFSASKN